MNTELAKLEALNEVYLEACARKDYQTCEIVRLKMNELLTGRKNLIPCESKLDLNPNIF